MLTKRQYSILSFYVENRGTYVSSNELAAMFDISVRTVKNELKIVRDFCDSYSSFVLDTLAGKGTRLCVLDDAAFEKDMEILRKKTLQLSCNTKKPSSLRYENADGCDRLCIEIHTDRDLLYQ